MNSQRFSRRHARHRHRGERAGLDAASGAPTLPGPGLPRPRRRERPGRLAAGARRTAGRDPDGHGSPDARRLGVDPSAQGRPGDPAHPGRGAVGGHPDRPPQPGDAGRLRRIRAASRSTSTTWWPASRACCPLRVCNAADPLPLAAPAAAYHPWCEAARPGSVAVRRRHPDVRRRPRRRHGPGGPQRHLGWRVDSDRVAYSAALARHPRRTPRSTTSASLHAWLGRVHPDDVASLTCGARPPPRRRHARVRVRAPGAHPQRGVSLGGRQRGLAERDAAGRPTHLAGTLADVTERNRTDPLAGLPGTVRAARARRPAGATPPGATRRPASRCCSSTSTTSAAMNELLGHDTGDALLREALRRVSRCLREGDLVARLALERRSRGRPDRRRPAAARRRRVRGGALEPHRRARRRARGRAHPRRDGGALPGGRPAAVHVGRHRHRDQQRRPRLGRGPAARRLLGAGAGQDARASRDAALRRFGARPG